MSAMSSFMPSETKIRGPNDRKSGRVLPVSKSHPLPLDLCPSLLWPVAIKHGASNAGSYSPDSGSAHSVLIAPKQVGSVPVAAMNMFIADSAKNAERNATQNNTDAPTRAAIAKRFGIQPESTR